MAACCSPLTTRAAARSTTSGHSAAISASVAAAARGRTPRMSGQRRQPGSPPAWRSTEDTVTASSPTAHDRVRSPKSMMPSAQAAVVGGAHHVVVGDVAVDHLMRQFARQVGDRAPRRHRGRLDQPPPHRIRHIVCQQVDGPIGVLQIPLQYPVDTRVVECGQRPAGPARERSQRGPAVRRDVAFSAHGAAGQVGDDPRVQQPAGAVGDLRDRGHAGQPDVAGAPHAWIGIGDELCRGVLGLDLDTTEHRVGDLEHADRLPVGGRQQKIGVLLAAQRARGDVEAEVFVRDRHRVVDRDRRGGQFRGLEEVEKCHRIPHLRKAAASLYFSRPIRWVDARVDHRRRSE